TFRLENRIFTLDSKEKGTDLAVLTILQDRSTRTIETKSTKTPPPSSISLEKITVTPQGKIHSADLNTPQIPLDRPPTLEVGAFVELPRLRSGLRQGWEVNEPGRPPQNWQIMGQETLNGHYCVKLQGTQQTDDWDRPRADRGAWRRQDTLWISTRSGVAQKYERIIEHHEPARKEVSTRFTLTCNLESCLDYPSQMAQDRRSEINQYLAFRKSSLPLLGDPVTQSTQLESLQKLMANHCDNHPPTPFREAMLQLKKRVEMGSKGELVTVAYQEPVTKSVSVAIPGEAAPDFLAGPITTREAGKLSKWKGKPLVLVFYNPSSPTAGELLRFADQLQRQYEMAASVVGLAVVDDAVGVRRQHEEMKLCFPVYHGSGMKISYGVESTPKIVLVDAIGVIRGMYLGWGGETPVEVTSELGKWLPKR
ncbi:MAG: peroxiredoxin family protein, partial [Gemmataceae bacterium]